jgi:hypothetical protein
MANPIYYYDNTSNTVKAIAPISVEDTPTLKTIQSFLNHDMGILSPLSILTVDSNSFLDQLKVSNLTATNITGTTIIGSLDGGDF